MRIFCLSLTRYEFEWQYFDDPAPPVGTDPYMHFVFMLGFPDVPPGIDHVAHFCFNVLHEPETTEPGISVVRRGFLVCVPFTHAVVTRFVEIAVAEAFHDRALEDALVLLNAQFINDDVDFSDEFAADLVEVDDLIALIDAAFTDVARGEGITLHQAIVIDNYGTQEEFLAAERLDTETCWQEVPDSALAEDTHFLNYLDPEGFRFYLPAAMRWAVSNYENDDYDNGFFTYLAVLPTVAPRDVGRGIGVAFDLDDFVDKHSFTQDQVNAIYRFICFMAIRAKHGIDEDQYAAVKKWRRAVGGTGA